MTITPQIRRLLIMRCQSARTRRDAYSPAMPTVWQPTQLRDPRTAGRSFFTEESAWSFIREMLEDDQVEVEELTLALPAGKKAYVMKVAGHPPGATIYIKLQLGSDKVICRSFHESRYP